MNKLLHVRLSERLPRRMMNQYRDYMLCVQYGNDTPIALYHGPSLDPRMVHPFFPGTVIYIGARDWQASA